MPAVDLLPLAGLTAGEALDVRAWEARALAPFVLTPGWWRITVDVDSGPLFLDMWSPDTGDNANLVLRPGQRQLFRTLGGRLEARLDFGPEAGRVSVGALSIEPVKQLDLLSDFLGRTWRMAASRDFSRITRAVRAALSSDIPLTLSPSNAGDRGSMRMLSTSTTFGVVIEGDADRSTLDSLQAQVGARWALANELTVVPDAWVNLRAGDRLKPNALAQIGDRFANPQVQAVYTDEAYAGERSTKPVWDAELARHADYVGGLVAWRSATTPEPVPIASAQDELAALALRAGDASIDRLALPLLDRMSPFRREPLATAPPLVRIQARVSVIVPTRDRPDLLGPCLQMVLDEADHSDLELIVVDNGTRDARALQLIEARRGDPRMRILRIDGPFNYSALNNAAVREATGEIVALLNNDVSARDPSWLSHLAARAAEPAVGAVGPLLFYADHTVQHAGVALGIGGVAGHPWKGAGEVEADRLLHLSFPQQRSALTAACLVMRRAVFLTAGGFDEDRFPVTLNDVDLCLKIRAAGLKLVMDPRIRMVHYESKSRPADREASQRKRVIAEQASFRAAWPLPADGDPFYSPALTRADESGALRC